MKTTNWRCCHLLQEDNMTTSKRYDRQIALPQIGISGQEKIAAARVLVVGAGGLGCPVIQNLAAAGIGQIGIVDGDVVAESNLHRQYLFTPNDCGKNKAQVAAMAVLKQNPQVKVLAHPEFFSASNAPEIIANYQIVVDCTDDNATRYLINDMALANGIPMVYAAIHQFEAQLSVFNYQDGPSYRCLFPEQTHLNGLGCADTGVLGVLPNTVGALQATEVFKIVLGLVGVLNGKLLLYDALCHGFKTVAFERNLLEIEKGKQKGKLLNDRKAQNRGEVSAAAFFDALETHSHLIIDIRETYEEPRLENRGIHNIPLAQLEHFIFGVAKKQSVILFCQRGNNSRMAVDYLNQKGFDTVFHLSGGIEALDLNLEQND